MWFLWKGILVGLSVAAPVGPIGLLCIQRTLAQGRLSGFMSGLGAATADGLYACAAGLGLSVIAVFMNQEQMYIRLIGGLLLCWMGVRSLFAKPADKAAALQDKSILWNYVSVLLLTITNPMTILSFMAVFAALGVSGTSHTGLHAMVTVVGVVTGSAVWWFTLSGLVSLFRKKLGATVVLWINRGSGVMLTAFGLFGVWSAGLIG